LNSKIACFLLPLSLFAARGDLISYTKKAQVSASEHKALCNSFSVNCTNAKDCDIYIYTYETISLDEATAQASGVLVVPKNGYKKNLLVYTHGTVSDKEGAPSNLGYHMQLPLSVFAQEGYIISIPDYLGIGQSSTIFHPFCHAQSLATASYDAAIASQKLISKLNLEKAKSLFVAGYSEGGMAALALHRYIEEHPFTDISFKASCPMSGPYDLTSSISFALNSKSPRMNTYISYVLAAYNNIYPGVLPSFDKVFSNEINYMIPLLFDGCHAFWTINAILNRINPLLNSDFIQTTLTKGSKFLERLQENDTYKFYPKIQIHFIGLENDTEVGYLNTLQAYNYMKKNNCPVTVESASSTLDHMQGSALCHMQALKFFSKFN
jgi:hypothetical protein